MGNVIIIKNNSVTNSIYKYAMESYKKHEEKYYNSMNNTVNENCINEIKNNVNEDETLLLLIAYEQGKDEDKTSIKDMFVGNNVTINEHNNIKYQMLIHYQTPKHDRTIQSIVEKIDLDLNTDFVNYNYVMNSDMEILYQELRERIEAKTGKFNKENSINDSHMKTEEEKAYKLNCLAQENCQARHIFDEKISVDGKTEFQIDREKVVNSEAFRRLVDKAQIFSAEKGDYFRTRMTHTLEVNQIAKAIAYALRLNLDLTEAIALGHDLGHTPFGHQGERTLDDILAGKINVGIIRPSGPDGLEAKRCFGGFKHNYQSAKVLTCIEEKDIGYKGLNVSVQVVEGVLKHTRLKPNEIQVEDFLPEQYRTQILLEKGEKQICATLEGQVVAVADEIAQRGHDVDDALTSGVMSINELLDRLKINKCHELYKSIMIELQEIQNVYLKYDIKKLQISRIVSCIIQYFVNDAIKYSERICLNNSKIKKISMLNKISFVELSPEVRSVSDYLEKVVQKKVICNNEVARADYNASVVIKTLFKKYYENPRLLHAGTVRKIYIETLKHENENVAYSAVNIGDASVKLANAEIEEMSKSGFKSSWKDIQDGNAEKEDIVRFEKRKILIRAIVDFIAGMTDGYAIEEYEKLK